MDINLYDEIDTSFSIEKLKVKGIYNMEYRHYHDAYEIYYLLQGERNYFIKDRTYTVTKGNLVFINMNDLHKTLDAKKGKIFYERILINFKRDFFDTMLTPIMENKLSEILDVSSGIINLDFEERSNIEELLLKIIKEQNKNLPHSDLFIKSLLLELLIKINRSFKSNSIDSENTHKNENIFKVVRYLNSNYSEQISLKSLSEIFFISESHLSRSFKKVTGFNIINYLNIIRIKEA